VLPPGSEPSICQIYILEVLSKTLKISFHWIVAYAGFEAKEKNLKAMNISFDEFTTKIKTSAIKLQKKMNCTLHLFCIGYRSLSFLGVYIFRKGKNNSRLLMNDISSHRVMK